MVHFLLTTAAEKSWHGCFVHGRQLLPDTLDMGTTIRYGLRVSVSHDALNLCLLGFVFSFRGHLLVWRIRLESSPSKRFRNASTSTVMSNQVWLSCGSINSFLYTNILYMVLRKSSRKQQAPISNQAEPWTLPTSPVLQRDKLHNNCDPAY